MSATADSDVPRRLIMMSNQISGFFKPYPPEQAVAGIAEHISKFWDYKMRATILAYLERGGEGLDTHVIEALKKIRPIQKG